MKMMYARTRARTHYAKEKSSDLLLLAGRDFNLRGEHEKRKSTLAKLSHLPCRIGF